MSGGGDGEGNADGDGPSPRLPRCPRYPTTRPDFWAVARWRHRLGPGLPIYEASRDQAHGMREPLGDNLCHSVGGGR